MYGKKVKLRAFFILLIFISLSLTAFLVFKSFEETIDEKKIDPDYQFYSLNIENIEKVFVEGSRIKICINFISEQFKNNDENTVVKKQDSWTFEKNISSKDPNWLLSST